jgi:NADH-quinone oxidoreductase subunit F
MVPTDLESYQKQGGFAGLHHAVNEMTPKEVIQVIKSSGLSGRGGAAFPTGLKWELTASSLEPERYLVCNADESEPGTFKDRVLLEGDPFSILEGMILAAYSIDAHQGYLFIRGEYSQAQSIMVEAIHTAREQGLLGDGILGSTYSFDVELRSGAGAYICGEETALFEAIEGKRGYPRLKPPYPTTHGLFGKPTLINNVETLSAVTWIVAHGSEAFRSQGTSDSPGTKLFCLTGDVNQPGVYEVPFGRTLDELINLAGGQLGKLKGVLLGGAAGSFARSDEVDLKMSFEDLQAAGHSLGSGVIFVINEDRDLSVILHSLADFFSHESCGKCFPCQLGTQRQLEIIDRWASGRARSMDREALEDVIFAMAQGSICGLGMTAGTAIHSAYVQWPELWEGSP